MNILIEIVLPILLGLAIYILMAYIGYKDKMIKSDQNFIRSVFASGNTLTEGAKGTGKDILFSFINRDILHYSNIRYNKLTEVSDIKDFNAGENTFNNLLLGEIIILDKTLEEYKDLFVSDGGIILPATEDKALHKLYPSFPVFYALQRHMYNSNTHINTQNFERVWKIVREQADGYFRCNHTTVRKCLGLKIATTSLTYYSTLKGISNRIQPVDIGLFATQAHKDFVATQRSSFGEVRALTLKQIIRSDHYDSRAYHEKLFGYNAPTD